MSLARVEWGTLSDVRLRQMANKVTRNDSLLIIL